MNNVQFSAKGGRGEIWLYDQIGADFFGEGIRADDFRKQLTGMGQVSSINLRINSPGGDVFDGVAIYNLLAQHPARIEVDVDGLCASIASVIAMAGDEIRISRNASFMIHNPQGMAYGDDREMQRVSALLAQVKGNLIETYAARTGASRDKLSDWMDAETWLHGPQAVEYGFADRVTEDQRVTACFPLLARFRNTPKALLPQARTAAPTATASDIARVRIARMEQRAAALRGAP